MLANALAPDAGANRPNSAQQSFDGSPFAAATATLTALDALIEHIEASDSVDAEECAEWAGVCEEILVRTDRLRLAVRSKSTPAGLRLIQGVHKTSLARAMSLGGASSSLLREDSTSDALSMRSQALSRSSSGVVLPPWAKPSPPPPTPCATAPPASACAWLSPYQTRDLACARCQRSQDQSLVLQPQRQLPGLRLPRQQDFTQKRWNG